MTDDLEMMRSSDMERKKMKRLQLIAAIPLVCAACGPLMVLAIHISRLLMMAMLALCLMGTPFGIIIGPLVLNLRKDLYVMPEDQPLSKRVKTFAVLDIVFGVLCVLFMGFLFVMGM